ncbi:MAG: GNAT family N-acetyltransferase [Gammaproteobacteria bacterium]|nr:GNAT family N-acetyltransferase [Gammaproteobacteria bacterium]
MDYCIEPASQADGEAILSVLRHFNMHHVPSVEMERLDLKCFFIARLQGSIVGAAGYKIISETEGKTTLFGVLPEYCGLGIGKKLQHKRMEAMYKAGVKKVTTNADRPETILWYKKHYGYHQIGSLKKLCSFGLEDVDHWTTLQTNLDDYFAHHEEIEQDRLDYIVKNDAYPLAPYPPLIINVCLTGMIPTKAQTPHVPISCEEIIEDAVAVYDAGATLVHIHARDKNGYPTPDVSYYEKIITGIRRERPEMICVVTTSGRNWSDFERRSAVLYLDGNAKPDMASLTLGSLNFITSTSISSIHMIESLAMAMKEQGVKPELEIFDPGMITLAKYLERNRIIGGKKYFNLLLGNLNTAPATIGNLTSLAEALPSDSVWAGGGLGQFQLPINAAAIIAGGHVRVGLEDSIFYDYKKNRLATNKQLVERVVRIAREMQRPIATPDQARRIIGL